MILAILANDSTKAEILRKGVPPEVEITWVDSLSSLKMVEADAWFDLQFRNDLERNARLSGVTPLFIGAVEVTTETLPVNAIRINSWPGMIERPLLEITAGNEYALAEASRILKSLNWNFEVTPDIPGFISGRVLAEIINEAYFTLESETSTKEEIDIAMKLGTNYPNGPFEWCKKLGIKNVYNLLAEISVTDDRYIPSTILKNELNGLDPEY
ncbi:MAG: 3-hydroxyacyl-CoA dehydrogenase family protein [Flavitalea sp.]